ncbi:MAG: cysteine desulfurase [Balneolaceae bacterium]|nr:cysteine desulfurase [Balneolaceae bacterium]
MADTITRQQKDGAVDFDRLREDFPVLARQVNGRSLVYLDNAASSQMPRQVAERLHRYHTAEHANVHRGIHTLSQQATDAYESTRRKVRTFLNAPDDGEIVYTTGTTDSINLVASSWAEHFLEEGDEILLTEIEHHANIVPWQMAARKTGASITVAPVNDRGELDRDAFSDRLGERTALVALGHVSNALGTVHPVGELIAEAHACGVPVLVDGAQAVPHSPVDLKELDADFYAFSSHKMCGPTGFGILYAKKEHLERMPPYRGGGDMIEKVTFEESTWNHIPHKFEAGTPPIAAGIGLGAAVDYLSSIGMERIEQREQELLAYVTGKLQEIAGLRIVGTAAEKASVISFVLEDIHATDVGTILNQQGVAVRTGHHCAQPTMRRFGVPATVRASLSFYNSFEDIDRLADGVRKAKEFF